MIFTPIVEIFPAVETCNVGVSVDYLKLLRRQWSDELTIWFLQPFYLNEDAILASRFHPVIFLSG
jgi:hypothetical protein